MDKENEDRPIIEFLENDMSDSLKDLVKMCLQGLIEPKANSRDHVKETRPGVD